MPNQITIVFFSRSVARKVILVTHYAEVEAVTSVVVLAVKMGLSQKLTKRWNLLMKQKKNWLKGRTK